MAKVSAGNSKIDESTKKTNKQTNKIEDIYKIELFSLPGWFVRNGMHG